MVTVDASVFVAERDRTEPHHLDSDKFLKRLAQKAIGSFCPNLVVPETTAAIARPTGDGALARAAILQIEGFPYLSLIELTVSRAVQASDICLSYRLPGADAVCVAVAQELGMTLITWYNEMRTRAPAAVPTITPTDWLAANPV